MSRSLYKKREYLNLSNFDVLGGTDEEVSFNTVENLIKANSIDKMLDYAERHYGYVYLTDEESESLTNKDIAKEYFDYRECMMLAMNSKAFIDSGDWSSENFMKVTGGIWVPKELKMKTIDDIRRTTSDFESPSIHIDRDGNSDYWIEKSLSKIGVRREISHQIQGVPIYSKRYLEFLKRSIKEQGICPFTAFLVPSKAEDELARLVIGFGLAYSNDDNGRFEAAKDTIDILATVNMNDIKTISTDGGFVGQRCESFISSLWIALTERMGKGRALLCKECGKPIITISERGNPREFCDDKCRKKHDRDEVRAKARKMYEKGMSLEDAVKTIGKEALIIKSEYKKLTR